MDAVSFPDLIDASYSPRHMATLLRQRARRGREIGLKLDFYALPSVVQDATYGMAADLEVVADTIVKLSHVPAGEEVARTAMDAVMRELHDRRGIKQMLGEIEDEYPEVYDELKDRLTEIIGEVLREAAAE